MNKFRKLFLPHDPLACHKIAQIIATNCYDTLLLPAFTSESSLLEEIFRISLNKTITIYGSSSKECDAVKKIVAAKCPPEKVVSVVSIPFWDLLFTSEYEPFCMISSHEQTPRKYDGAIPKVGLFIPLPSKYHDQAILHALFRKVLSTEEDRTFDILLPRRTLNIIDATPGKNFLEYRSFTVLANSVFSIKKFMHLDLSTDFIGLKSKYFNNSRTKNATDICLTRLYRKESIPNFLVRSTWPEYSFLVIQSMSRRKIPIFEFVDKWFGNCHQDLENIGLSKNTRSGDMSVDDYLRLFKYLREREDYTESTFFHAVDRLNRIQLS